MITCTVITSIRDTNLFPQFPSSSLLLLRGQFVLQLLDLLSEFPAHELQVRLNCVNWLVMKEVEGPILVIFLFYCLLKMRFVLTELNLLCQLLPFYLLWKCLLLPVDYPWPGHLLLFPISLLNILFKLYIIQNGLLPIFSLVLAVQVFHAWQIHKLVYQYVEVVMLFFILRGHIIHIDLLNLLYLWFIVG